MRHLPKIDEFPSYKGGHTVLYGRYIFEFAPNHPLRNLWGYVAQHRLVAEDQIGRPLARGEDVHHIDHNPLNNHPSNLQVMKKADHNRLHMQELRSRNQRTLTEAGVREALQAGGLKHAAKKLGVHTQTLRNRFPELVSPYKRKAPTKIEDDLIVDTIRRLAPDPMIGYREIARQHGIAAMTVKRICERNNIPWVKKTRKGEKHRTYRRKTASRQE